MFRKPIAILVVVVFATNALLAQGWSLEECIDYALDNNISIQQVELSKQVTENNYSQSKLSLLPSLSASASHTYNFGNSINPTTYEYQPLTTQSNSFGISSSLVLWSGTQQLQSIKKSAYDLEAIRYDLESMKDNIALVVTSQYLQALLAKESVKIAEDQIDLTNQQLQQTQDLVDAGILPKGNLLDVEAQLAQDEANLINAQNASDLALMNLQVTLQKDLSEPFTIEYPADIADQAWNPESLSPYEVYTDAAATMPMIKSSEFRLLSAEKSLSIAKGAQSPTFTVNGNAYTNYYDKDVNIIGFNPDGTPITEPVPFWTQIDDNFSQSVGVSMYVPIFNGWQTRTNIANAQIGIMSAKLDLEDQQNQLKQDVFTAYTNALAAEKSYAAASKSLEAVQKSYDYSQARYEVGAMNTFEFNTIKNNLAAAESQLLRDKYDYIFKLKILDYYQGEPLRLE